MNTHTHTLVLVVTRVCFRIIWRTVVWAGGSTDDILCSLEGTIWRSISLQLEGKNSIDSFWENTPSWVLHDKTIGVTSGYKVN